MDALLSSRDRFLRFLERRVESRAEAEDLLQTALLRATTEVHAVHDEDRIVAWFQRLLRNLVVDHYRHRAAQDRARARFGTELQADASAHIEVPATVCTCVNEVINVLKSVDAELIRRVEIDGQHLPDVASDLGLTVNNASVRLHRARRALRKALHATCGPCAEYG